MEPLANPLEGPRRGASEPPMPMRSTLFTSESVSMGHPDKLADQISDSILDAMLEKDPFARVACETLVTTGLAVIAGEVTCDGYVEIPDVVRQVAVDVGYDDPAKGFDGRSAGVVVAHGQGLGLAARRSQPAAPALRRQNLFRRRCRSRRRSFVALTWRPRGPRNEGSKRCA